MKLNLKTIENFAKKTLYIFFFKCPYKFEATFRLAWTYFSILNSVVLKLTSTSCNLNSQAKVFPITTYSVVPHASIFNKKTKKYIYWKIIISALVNKLSFFKYQSHIAHTLNTSSPGKNISNGTDSVTRVLKFRNIKYL